jgi:hypothetical protein
MEGNLTRAWLLATTSPALAEFDVRQEGGELHLSRKGDCFARLFPADRPGCWRLKCLVNHERWQPFEFVGTLEECLELLGNQPHYLFWEG